MDQNFEQSLPQQSIAQAPDFSDLKKNSKRKILFILTGIVILLGVLGGSYYLVKKHTQLIQKNATSQIVQKDSYTLATYKTSGVSTVKYLTPTATPTPDLTATWKTFTNSTYKFIVKYPTSVYSYEENSPYYFVAFCLYT